MSIGAPELKAISEATAMLATCDHMSEFASRVLASVKRLIPADIVAYGEVDLVRDRATTLADDRASCSAPLSDVWAELTLSEPIRSYWGAMRLGRSACFSDYVDFPQLERFEIFQRYYRPIGVRHQLVGPLSVDDSVISSVGLSRSDPDGDARGGTVTFNGQDDTANLSFTGDGSSGSFSNSICYPSGDTLTIVMTDAAGNASAPISVTTP